MQTRYPAGAVERAMRVQEVILRAIDGRLKWYQAAEILGISDRQMRRWKRRYERVGYDGLLDRRQKQPSPKRVPVKTVQEVLRLYREGYFDFNVKHFHEQLRLKHGIELSYSWVKAALQGAGLVAKDPRRGPHRKARPRRPLVGMMLHTDASTHPWIPDLGCQDLIVVLDDAASEVYYAQFVLQESTPTMMAALKAVVAQHGLVCSLYVDRAGHFITTRTGRSPHRPQQATGPTQIEQFVPFHNRTWTQPAAGEGSAFVPYSGADLDRIFAIVHERVVGQDNCVEFKTHRFQILPSRWRYSFAQCRVKVYEHLDGTISIGFGPHLLGRFRQDSKPLARPQAVHAA